MQGDTTDILLSPSHHSHSISHIPEASTSHNKRRMLNLNVRQDSGHSSRRRSGSCGWSIEMLWHCTCWPPRVRCSCLKRWLLGTLLALKSRTWLRTSSKTPLSYRFQCVAAMCFVFCVTLLALACLHAESISRLFENPATLRDFYYPTSGNRSLQDILYHYEMHGRDALSTYVKPINNYHRFQYTRLPSPMTNRSDAHNSMPYNLLIAVKTTHNREKHRDLIRQTWGRAACYEKLGAHAQIVFLFGATSDVLAERNLQAEHERYQDIVQKNFDDAYFNNTYKFMMALDYAASRLGESRGSPPSSWEQSYAILVDDDYTVSPVALMQFLKKEISSREVDTFIGGAVLYHAEPFRSPFSKWHMSYKEYPFSHYPDYISGGFIVMSSTMVTSLHVCMPFVQYFPFDDVLLGIVLFQLRIAPRHMQTVYESRSITEPLSRHDIASHGYSTREDLLRSWKEMQLQQVCPR